MAAGRVAQTRSRSGEAVGRANREWNRAGACGALAAESTPCPEPSPAADGDVMANDDVTAAGVVTAVMLLSMSPPLSTPQQNEQGYWRCESSLRHRCNLMSRQLAMARQLCCWQCHCNGAAHQPQSFQISCASFLYDSTGSKERLRFTWPAGGMVHNEVHHLNQHTRLMWYGTSTR